MNKCSVCNRNYEYKRSAGGTKTTCNSCTTRLRRNKLKRRVIDFLGGHCLDCGYRECSSALVVHHTDEESKEFEISDSLMWSWSRIEKELLKCILLCANCHNKRHHNCERFGCARDGGEVVNTHL
jgi:hypothetical protein